ncbi:hypothetical protein [Amycolatopsis sp. H20-H5]|uniref:hypothetical protein n=1 Tax=Amycolatopsis sp. H20-H5 TaxID=3046309 RepID=UPI002DB6B013|nr:hypothetical protein [Amycolatopsis sp. H20-H5]MEC3974628.1 hypothetical protein [Amycolatopsis sp. H20-H5]
MTDESLGLGETVGPPWSVDVLADLHAGVLQEHEAAELWPLVRTDPDAMAILGALDSTRSDLAGLALAPVEPMPAEFAARLDAALAGLRPEAPQLAPVVSMEAARKKRNKRLGWGAGLLTVAAAAIAAVAIIVPASQTAGQGSSVAQPGGPPPVGPSVGGDGAGADALAGKSLGIRDFGPLGNEQRLDACLAANGLDPAVRPEGIQPVNVNGKAGVLVTFTTGKLAQYRVVAFGADCGPGNPSKLFDKVVGKK